jgi:SAM-dependent methyltransferase
VTVDNGEAALAAQSELSLSDIIRLNDHFHDSALLHMAIETELFDRLITPSSAQEVAAEMGWVERKTRIVLDALAAMGVLHKDGTHYRNTQSSVTFLTTTSDAYVGAIIDHQRLQWELWRRMGDVLESDAPVEAQQELRLKKDPAANDAFQRAMVQLSRDNVADVLAIPDFARTGRVLDLCGGHGTYLARLAEKHPNLTGEVWDLETARERALQTFARHGVADRLTFKVVDVLTADAFAGEMADACMLNDCLHYFDEGDVRTLIGRAAALLESDGLLVVLTMTLASDGIAPPSAAGFSLHMMLNTNHGVLHPTAWIEDVMRKSGLDVESRPLGSLGRYTLVIGRKLPN